MNRGSKLDVGIRFANLRPESERNLPLIRVNYAALRKDDTETLDVSDELLKKAKGRFGFGARKELNTLFSSHVRLLAMEVAQRQMNPQLLYNAGMDGLIDALKVYDIGQNQQAFKDFATPFIKRSMQTARSTKG
jgi:hypothetical protein